MAPAVIFIFNTVQMFELVLKFVQTLLVWLQGKFLYSLALSFLSLLDYYCLVPMRFIPWEIRVAFSGESQL